MREERELASSLIKQAVWETNAKKKKKTPKVPLVHVEKKSCQGILISLGKANSETKPTSLHHHPTRKLGPRP